MSGAPSQGGAPAFSDQEVSLFYQSQFGMSAERATNFMKGYRLLESKMRAGELKVYFAAPELDGDRKWIYVTCGDSMDSIVERWIRAVPMMAEKIRLDMLIEKSHLNDPIGFSDARLMQLRGMIPKELYWSLVALDDDFWNDAKNVRRFFNTYPVLSGKR